MFEDLFKTVMGGAFISVIPLEIEANWLGLVDYRNSPYEFIVCLLFGIGLAWACHSDEVADDV